MALDLYSKGTTDTLLAAKLDLAGGTMTGALNLSASGIIFSDSTYLTTAPAGSTLAADQLTAGVVTSNPTSGPTASGDVLQYDGSGLIWAPGGGGGAVAWGSITGTLSDQTDLQSALDGKLSLSGGNLIGDFTYDTAGVHVQFGSSDLLYIDTTTYEYGNISTSGVIGGNSGSGAYTQVNSVGVRFPDNSVQTTAAPSALKIKANMYAASASFDGSYLRIYAGPQDVAYNFSSSSRWFATIYFGTLYAVNSISYATDSSGRPYAQVSCNGPGGSIDYYNPLYYTEDGGANWTPADLPIL